MHFLAHVSFVHTFVVVFTTMAKKREVSDADRLAVLVSTLIEKAAGGDEGVAEALKAAKEALEVLKRMEAQKISVLEIDIPAPVQAAIAAMAKRGGEMGLDKREFAGGSRLQARIRKSPKKALKGA